MGIKIKFKDEDLYFRSFQPDTMDPDAHTLFVGQTKTGKSFAMRDILSEHSRSYNRFLVFNGTESVNPFYSYFVPKGCISDNVNVPLLRKVIDSIEKKVGDIDDPEKKKQIQKSRIYSTRIVIDDNFDTMDEWLKKDGKDVFKFILTKGRHLNLSICLGTQEISEGMPRYFRSNMRYIFICRQRSIAEMERLHKYYAGLIPSFTLFKKMMDVFTANHGLMVIDRFCQSDNWWEAVTHFEAEDPGEFRVGTDELWKYMDNHYLSKKQLDKKKETEPTKKITIHKKTKFELIE